MQSSDLFELFATEQVLKDYSLSTEELQQGIIDGGNDGGIDSIYLFANGQLCCEDFLDDENIDNFKTNNTKLTLYIIQTKESGSFKETVTKFILSSIKDFFELDNDLNQNVYNLLFIEKRNLFKKIFLALAPFHPLVEIKFAYCTKGSLDDVNEKVNVTIQQIKDEVINTNITDKVEFNLYGSMELINLYRILPQYKLPLKFKEIMNLKNSYILLVSINDYYDFITDNNKIRDYLFEANIRDHQGNVAVNK